MADLSLAALFGIILTIAGVGFAVLAGRLRYMSTGRNDSPAGNAKVISSYWSLCAVFLITGLVLLALA
jgi:hypothetical protein